MIEISDKIFKTKAEATKFIQSILYKYPLDCSLIGDDLVFICELLELHPDRDKKIGVGVKSIIVEKDTTFGTTTHFSIIRTDESKTDFSFVKCLTPSLNKPIKLFYASARRAIVDQVVSFRDRYFIEKQNNDGNVVCALTGVLIDKNSSHVDHVPPETFYNIVLDFITINNINVNNVAFMEAADGVGREFAESSLKSAFSNYHRNIASLRVVSPLANLKQKKK